MITETETLGETRESEFRSPLVNLPLRFGQFNQFNSIFFQLQLDT